MTFNAGLLSLHVSELAIRKWYRERFDGAPFFLLLVGAAELACEERKYPGGEFGSHLVWFADNVGDWYIDMADIELVTALMIDKAAGNPRIGKDLIARWKNDEDKFFSTSLKFGKIQLSKLSLADLRAQFVSYIEIYQRAVTGSSLIDGFALGTDTIIQEKLTAFLQTRGMEQKQHEYFTILTAPTTQSFINTAELSLLRVAELIRQDHKFALLLRQSVTDAMRALPHYSDIEQVLQEHERKYFWSKNNYTDAPVLGASDFLIEIQALLLNDIDVIGQIEKIRQTPTQSLAEKRELYRLLRLPADVKALLDISEDFAYWQDERKKKHFG
mgnify:CR=1 FL=1